MPDKKPELKVVAGSRAGKPEGTAKAARPRRRGRPAVGENGLLDRKMIIACAFQMARDIPLQELSIVRVARELGVTPALIHYYLDGREALTSGVMRSFYQQMLEHWPQPTGNWYEDTAAVVRKVHGAHVEHPGIAAYVIAHTRFRLKLLPVEGEPDYGVVLFERIAATVRAAGHDAHHTAMWTHLLIEFIISMAYGAVRHRFPSALGDHLDAIFIEADPAQFPAMHFIHHDFVRLNPGEVFPGALRTILHAIQQPQQTGPQP